MSAPPRSPVSRRRPRSAPGAAGAGTGAGRHRARRWHLGGTVTSEAPGPAGNSGRFQSAGSRRVAGDRLRFLGERPRQRSVRKSVHGESVPDDWAKPGAPPGCGRRGRGAPPRPSPVRPPWGPPGGHALAGLPGASLQASLRSPCGVPGAFPQRLPGGPPPGDRCLWFMSGTAAGDLPGDDRQLRCDTSVRLRHTRTTRPLGAPQVPIRWAACDRRCGEPTARCRSRRA